MLFDLHLHWFIYIYNIWKSELQSIHPTYIYWVKICISASKSICIFIMIVFHLKLHKPHWVLIFNAIAALQIYNSLPADEKRGLVAKYMAAGGIKGNLQQMLSASECSSSSKETSSEVIEGYMSLGACQVCLLFPLETFHGWYITLGQLLWGVMHIVNNFGGTPLRSDAHSKQFFLMGCHISYRYIYICMCCKSFNFIIKNIDNNRYMHIVWHHQYIYISLPPAFQRLMQFTFSPQVSCWDLEAQWLELEWSTSWWQDQGDWGFALRLLSEGRDHHPAGSTTQEGTSHQPFVEQVLLHSPTWAS